MHKKITFVTGCSGVPLLKMEALKRADNHPVERSFQAVLTVAAEQQPCCVQVVEWVAQVHLLVGKLLYYFLTRLLRVAQKPFFSTS